MFPQKYKPHFNIQSLENYSKIDIQHHNKTQQFQDSVGTLDTSDKQ